MTITDLKPATAPARPATLVEKLMELAASVADANADQVHVALSISLEERDHRDLARLLPRIEGHIARAELVEMADYLIQARDPGLKGDAEVEAFKAAARDIAEGLARDELALAGAA
jgi:CRISPR/Cas system-associated protein Csm6